MLDTINFKTKLLILTLLPMLGMLYFAQLEMRSAITRKAESETIVTLAEFSVIASSLVHELQKERGASAGYIGSGGNKFAKKLPQQHESTNKKIQSLTLFLESFESGNIPGDFSSTLQKARNDLQQIEAKRKGVLNLRSGLKPTLKYYTGLNTLFLALAGEMAKQSEQGELSRLASGYVNFLQSKERAGIERAVLANTFAADQFGAGMLNKLLGLITTQKIYLDVFYTFAPAAQIEFYEQTVQGEPITATKLMREVALHNASTGGFGVDPTSWFKMQTKKINLLKAVEDKLSIDLIDSAATVAKQAGWSFILSCIVFSGIFIGSLILAIYFVRTILNQLGADPKQVLEAINTIAAGKLDTPLYSGEKQESGVFAGIKTMQTNLLASREKERKHTMDISRIKQGLDNVTSNVMLADADCKIVYMNSSIKLMFKQIEEDLRVVFPDFDCEQLLGTSIDKFHKNPAHQRGLLSQLKDTFCSELIIGPCHLRIVANPVIAENGERLGTVVEWLDRTLEIQIEEEIKGIVSSVKAGQLDQRLELSNKQGFMASLSEGINEFSDVIENVFSDISSSMESIAVGDLNNRMEGHYEGVYLECKKNLNASVDKLNEIVYEIRASSNSINLSSKEVASGNNDLSQRAEQQAASLEQTAASMEQLTSTVQNNAENANQANRITTNTRRLAEQGGGVVHQAVSAMQEISESSNQIANIIGVIDEIAFQTNLLALNASVEAARAGEQGRGFSVVATEVRNLAQRSAKAAKDSKELIESSVKKVGLGTEYVNKTGHALNEIVSSVKDVSDIVAEIASASAEQSQGILQVNKAVSQLDEITQQNAALSEQTSAASISMSEQTGKMSALLKFFH